MRAQIRLAELFVVLALGGCAHRTAGMKSSSEPVNGAPSADGDVPSKRRGVILPSDANVGPSGPQPTTGTEGGRIGDSLGKGVGVGGSTP